MHLLPWNKFHSGKTAPFVIITLLTVAVLAAQILFIPNITNVDEVGLVVLQLQNIQERSPTLYSQEEDDSPSLVRGAESFLRFGCDGEILIVTGAVWVVYWEIIGFLIRS